MPFSRDIDRQTTLRKTDNGPARSAQIMHMNPGTRTSAVNMHVS